jgi:prepilin-type N-terminal cleavage/methylation domain-containing protein
MVRRQRLTCTFRLPRGHRSPPAASVHVPAQPSTLNPRPSTVRRDTRRGFTLIELLVTLTLMTIISAGIALAFGTSLPAFGVIQRRADAADETRTLTERLREDLQGAVLRPGSATTWFVAASPAFTVAGAGTVALPEGNLLTMTTTRPVSLDAISTDEGVGGLAGPQSDVAQVSYWLEPAPDGILELVRRERTPPDPEVDETQDPATTRIVLARGVREVNLRCFDGVEWHEEWSTIAEDETAEPETAAAGLPQIVEVTLLFEPGSGNAPLGALQLPDSGLSLDDEDAPRWSLVVALPQPVDLPQ